jgi:hypothetical protein
LANNGHKFATKKNKIHCGNECDKTLVAGPKQWVWVFVKFGDHV